jgi:predicted DsbA family dithiol-disulfide isomerase
MTTPLIVDYYSDVLCVWAWIAQRRNEELQEQWNERIELHHHYLNLFGDTAARIEKQWADRGGYSGFSRHVVDSARPYDEAPVNPDVWTKVRPATSANAHLVLKCAAIVASANDANRLELSIRRAFFVDALDIGRIPVLLKIADADGCDSKQIAMSIEDGTAAAALMADYAAANQQNISGSPSWVLNEGRQTLYGNVGYNVLHANVEGLLSHSSEEASWC